MNRQQTTLFIYDTSIGFDPLGMPETQKHYPHLIGAALARPLKSQRDSEILGRTLIKICQLAHPTRQIDVLREASNFLVMLPVREELRAIGKYYQGQVLLRTGQVDDARSIFEKLATDPQFLWKQSAVLSAAGCHIDSGDLDAALALYREAERVALIENRLGLLSTVNSQRMIGRIRSIQGDHYNALKSIESLYPLICHIAKIETITYYDCLNSWAVRLGNVRRFDEAEHLSNICLSSPFAPNFPNWSETRDELREARDAVAATVFVNVEQKPQQEPKAEAYAIQIPGFAAAPTDKRSINRLAEIESILESQLFFDRAAEETSVNYSCVKSEIKPLQSTSVLSKPHSDIRFVSFLSFSTTPTPKEKGPAAVQPVTAAEARPLFGPAEIVPDNRRPRAPPTIFRHPQSHLLIPSR